MWVKPPEGPLTAHFDWYEAVCRHCGKVSDVEAVRKTANWMEDVRELLGDRPIKVLSWCRCPVYNERVGGAKNSYHLKGMAVDIAVKGLTPLQVQARLAGQKIIGGLGSYPGFTHIDRNGKRQWSE